MHCKVFEENKHKLSKLNLPKTITLKEATEILEKILEQNIILQKRCTFLEEHCVGENDTRKSSQDTISR